MKCHSCGANLAQTNPRGETLIRNKGLVFKAHGMICVCPRCKSDVEFSPDIANQVHRRVVLFFQKNSRDTMI